MRIVKLATQGVRGLADGEWWFVPERGGAGHLAVVTGPAGCGLTTFLEAIAAGVGRLSSGGIRADAGDLLRSGGTVATIRLRFKLEPEEGKAGGVAEEELDSEVVVQRGNPGRADADPAILALVRRYDHQPTTSKIVLLPARRVVDPGPPLLGDFEAEQRLVRLSPDPSRFAGIAPELVRAFVGYADRARFDAAADLFAKLCDGKVQLSGAGPQGLIFALASGARVGLTKLSFSERNAFTLASMVALCAVDRSTVLLDTPELGLAPGVAKRWVDALRAAAPEAQWIVATRDAEVVASAAQEARITLRPWGEAR
jgi:hypothetical protein